MNKVLFIFKNMFKIKNFEDIFFILIYIFSSLIMYILNIYFFFISALFFIISYIFLRLRSYLINILTLSLIKYIPVFNFKNSKSFFLNKKFLYVHFVLSIIEPFIYSFLFLNINFIASSFDVVKIISSICFFSIMYSIMILAIIVFLLKVLKKSNKNFYNDIKNEIKKYNPGILFHHSGPNNSLYQINQWIPVLEKLDKKTLIILRDNFEIEKIKKTKLMTILVKDIDSIENILFDPIKIVLYPSNAMKNTHLLRMNNSLIHIFINHGESDKNVNISPFLKVYNKLFVAGQMAIDRFKKQKFKIPLENFVIVGRPQLDFFINRNQIKKNNKIKTILYAPTWEGWFNDDKHCSIGVMGANIIKKLYKYDPDIKIIFKPHPYTGKIEKKFKKEIRKIKDIINENSKHKLKKIKNDLFYYFEISDVLITDISSVANDFLITDKPYIITNTTNLSTVDFHEKFLTSKGAYIIDKTLKNFEKILRFSFQNDILKEERLKIKKYSLEYTKGSSIKEFNKAINKFF